MKLYYLLPLLTLNCAFLSSCGDSGGGDSGGGEATSEVKSSVRAKLPLYYDIQKVSAETSEQNMMGEMLSITQLAIEVTLKENLYKRSSMTQELSEKLKLASDKVHFTIRSTFNANNKTFIEKVASKGETKTLYGELMTKKLADGKESIEGFRMKDASGSPISTFNASEVLIAGSEEETQYVQNIIDTLELKQKEKTENEAKVAAEKKAKEEAILKGFEDRYQQRLEAISSALEAGKVYTGALKGNSAEEIEISVESFDQKLMHGILKIKSSNHDYACKINFTLKQYKRGSEKYVQLSGTPTDTGNPDRELKSKSLLASKARTLGISNYSISEAGIVSIKTLGNVFIVFSK